LSMFPRITVCRCQNKDGERAGCKAAQVVHAEGNPEQECCRCQVTKVLKPTPPAEQDQQTQGYGGGSGGHLGVGA